MNSSSSLLSSQRTKKRITNKLSNKSGSSSVVVGRQSRWFLSEWFGAQQQQQQQQQLPLSSRRGGVRAKLLVGGMSGGVGGSNSRRLIRIVRALLVVFMATFVFLRCLMLYSYVTNSALSSSPNNELLVARPPVAVGKSGIIIDSSSITTTTTRNDDEDPKVLLFTCLFGSGLANQGYYRLFVESVRYSGVDVAILGDTVPPFDLPPNVHYVHMTWPDMVDRMQAHVYPNEPNCCESLKTWSQLKKLGDFKPLFGAIFADVVEGYDWWGFMDTDLIIGDFRRFFTRKLLNNYDIISGSSILHVLGPFTLFRNTPVINELYRRSILPLSWILKNPMQVCFDEWLRVKELFYRFGMAGIVENAISELGIRWTGIDTIVWDGSCTDLLGRRQPCRECLYQRLPDGKQKLFQTYEDSHRVESQVFICHFQYQKKLMAESVQDPALVKEMIDRGSYRINFREGFSLQNETAPI